MKFLKSEVKCSDWYGAFTPNAMQIFCAMRLHTKSMPSRARKTALLLKYLNLSKTIAWRVVTEANKSGVLPLCVGTPSILTLVAIRPGKEGEVWQKVSIEFDGLQCLIFYISILMFQSICFNLFYLHYLSIYQSTDGSIWLYWNIIDWVLANDDDQRIFCYL